jgi:hypothetical protein
MSFKFKDIKAISKIFNKLLWLKSNRFF